MSDYKSRSGPVAARNEMATVFPRLIAIRRASGVRLRWGVPRMAKRFPPANISGLGDILVQGGKVPPGGTSSLLTVAQSGGAAPQVEHEALESLGRTRMSRAPHLKYDHLLGPVATSMGRALAYFRRVMKESGD